MSHSFARAALAVAVALTAACADGSGVPTTSATSPAVAPSPLEARSSSQGFGFNGTLSGAPTGVVVLTGGGSFDATTASNVVPTGTRASAGGHFRCVDTVAQGPLNGCAAGEGVRWDTVQLLASTNFRCTGADAVKSGVTGPGRVVLLADFYRAGDGNEKSFRAPMIVSDHDLAPDLAGEQTVWIQGVGCGDANVNFSR
jgi:hypothetical protein